MQPRTLLLVALVALLPLAFAHIQREPHAKKPLLQADIIDASNIDEMFAASASTDLMAAQFSAFMKAHGKVYASPEEQQHRFLIFKQNMQIAADLSKKNPSAKFGVNQYADLHKNEFAQRYLNYIPSLQKGEDVEVRQASEDEIDSIPASYDWRHPDQGRPVAVTAVKDQGQCGSCWAFSATEAVESGWILAGNQAVALAPQQTVDCDTVDQGCNGGDTITAYQYISGVGLEAESTYPYTSGTSGAAGTCAYNASSVVAKMTSYAYATPGCNDTCSNQNEAQLAESLYNVGPVSICVDASTWQTYQSGILTSASGCQSAYSALDHCVQLVGYGVDASSNQKYWSVRNSWNAGWGEQGYIRLLYGQNTCGVADEATQVTA